MTGSFLPQACHQLDNECKTRSYKNKRLNELIADSAAGLNKWRDYPVKKL
jgi:hypothetical protein